MFFSIVVPIYNKSYSIPALIECLDKQAYHKFEVILINDGSTDDSLEVLINLLDQKPALKDKCRIFSQKNKGVSFTRNLGTKLAHSEYICFLDADDYWDYDYLSEQKKLIEHCPEANMFCLGHKLSLKDNIVIPNQGYHEGYMGYVDDFFKRSMKGDLANSSKVCIKKEVLLDIGGFPEKAIVGEDLTVWCLIALKGKIACSIKYLVTIVQTKDLSRNNRKNTVPYPIIFFSQNKQLLTSSLKIYLYRISLLHIAGSLAEKRYKEALFRIKATWQLNKLIGFIFSFTFFIPSFIYKKLKK